MCVRLLVFTGWCLLSYASADTNSTSESPDSGLIRMPDDLPTEPAEGSCRLPEPPRFGAYTSIHCSRNDIRPACRNIPGTLVNNGWVLRYFCNSGYSLNNDYAFPVCFNGEWSSKLDCVKLCPPLKSLSVDLKCSYNKKEVPCDLPVRPKTTAKAKCKPFYRQDILDNLNCFDNGEWSAPLFSCTPVCGVPGTLTPLIVEGNKTRQGEFPWLAALYYHNYNTDMWEQKCGGTLITPHIVLTAAHCLVQQSTNIRLQPNEIKVGLGKYYRDFSKIEPFAVTVDVREVIFRNEYKGVSSNYALDIGLLDLVESVQVNAYVMPACVDWTNLFRPAPNAVGIVAGWGKTETGKSSEVILSAQLTYIGYARCFNMIRALYKKLLSHDKFCGKSDSSGGHVDSGDSGGGLTFLNENRQHLLIGIVSAEIPGEETIRLFTDITNSEHSTWLEDETNRLKHRAHQGKEQVCLLPETSSNRKFCSLAAGCEDCDYYHKRCHLPPGSSADRVTVVCAPEYTIQGVQTNNKVVVCSAEGWSPTLHECLKQCPPPKSDSLQLTCQYDNKQVPCTKPALPDTTVTFKCLPGFSEYPDLKRGGSYRKHITCKRTGEWSGTFPPCKQVCGVSKGITSSNTTTENGSKDAKIGFFPWHAGVYHRRENDEGEISWEQRCAGSLISDRVVLTVAHCLHQRNNSDLRVALGKYYRSWYKQEPTEQKRNVTDIIYPRQYNPNIHTFDIALLVLSEKITLSEYIMPICRDYDEETAKLHSFETYVVGWFKLRGEEPSETLLYNTVTTLSDDACKKEFPFFYPTFEEKTCAYNNETGFFINQLRGSSGGGQTAVYEDGLHYILGVVSTRVNDVGFFTNLKWNVSRQWIDDEITKVNKKYDFFDFS